MNLDVEELFTLVRSIYLGQDPDGSLIEIYVFETLKDDWLAALSVITEFDAKAIMKMGSRQISLSSGEISFMEDSDYWDGHLSLRLGASAWTSTLPSESRIDFQGDPREIRSIEDLRIILRFMHRLYRSTGKRTVLVPESVDPDEVAPYASFPDARPL